MADLNHPATTNEAIGRIALAMAKRGESAIEIGRVVVDLVLHIATTSGVRVDAKDRHELRRELHRSVKAETALASSVVFREEQQG